MKTIVLNKRVQCDLEMIMIDAFKPLKGFLNKDDYVSVLDNMRLTDGTLWPIPIVLPVKDNNYIIGEDVMLVNMENTPIAKIIVESIYKPDIYYEATKIFGIYDTNHPYISIMEQYKNYYYIGGTVTKIKDIVHYDFIDLRKTPKEIKQKFIENNWKNIIGFQTRNPMHRSHYELTKYALSTCGDIDAKLFLNPVVGVTQECDIDYHTRVACYKHLLKYYNKNTVELCLLPLSMRMAGPREAVWHAIIRKNYGCTHFIVGRDHAGPSYKRKDGNNFYGPYEAQEMLTKYSEEIGIKPVFSKWIVYAKPFDKSMEPLYLPVDEIDNTKYEIQNISGTELRNLLIKGESIPEWFTFPEISTELLNATKKKGKCYYLVGLSGSGKSTIANALREKLRDHYPNDYVTILDGDIVRQELSKGLGFSKEDRSLNVRRIGFVASEIVKHGGIVICANIAPYNDDRIHNRKLIEPFGKYIEIFVNTPLEICESRDTKGLYKLARQGIIQNFTGINDPFENPTNTELEINGEGDLNILLEKIINI